MGRPATTPWAYVKFVFSGMEKNFTSIVWFTGSGTPATGYDYATAVGALRSPFVSLFLACMGEEISNIGAYGVIKLSTRSYGAKVYQISASASASAALPEDVAGLVSLIAVSGSNVNEGRLFIGGFESGQTRGSYITDNTAQTALCTQLKTSIVDQGITWKPAVYSPKDNSLYAITSANPISLLATQRRRKTNF